MDNDEIKRRAQHELEKYKALADGIREGLGLGERVKWRNLARGVVGEGLERMENSSTQRPIALLKRDFVEEKQFNYRSGSFLKIVRERFNPKPELSPEDLRVLEEKRKQLLENAERRKRVEEEDQKRQETAKSIARAKESISIGNL